MTLVELLLVLVLLAIASSLAVPSILNSFSSTRLRRAGDQVLARWAEARTTAIESGTVYQFRFGVDTSAFRVEPWSSVPADNAGDQTMNRIVTRENEGDSAAPSQGMVLPSDADALEDAAAVQGQLNDGITFQQGQAVAEEPLSGQVQATTLTGEGDWSTPILFFPDGTSSQATVVLSNGRDHYIRLTLRALVGVGRSSGVLTRDELQSGAATR